MVFYFIDIYLTNQESFSYDHNSNSMTQTWIGIIYFDQYEFSPSKKIQKNKIVPCAQIYFHGGYKWKENNLTNRCRDKN
eukprot:snap_masked-scaffold_10-processed-gene-5.26-mRNA-1 protein AED:1.00 eAED:1.00 QI:0/0/0/0/1/1/2/0/78